MNNGIVCMYQVGDSPERRGLPCEGCVGMCVCDECVDKSDCLYLVEVILLFLLILQSPGKLDPSDELLFCVLLCIYYLLLYLISY